MEGGTPFNTWGGDSRTKSMINKMPPKSEKAFTKLILTLCFITYKVSRVLNVNAFPWEALERCMSQTLEAWLDEVVLVIYKAFRTAPIMFYGIYINSG